MQTEKRKLSDLKLDDRNARKHNFKNIEAIKYSLEKFGQQKNIVVDSEGKVIAGNGTVVAARELGWKEITVTVTDLKGADLIAFGLADNRSAELAEWDDDVRAELLAELDAVDFDIESIGFDLGELTDEKKGLTDPDDAPELPEEPKTKLGDIYKLGNHRLMCGDSTDKDTVEKLMDGKKADMWLTDPPYNVAYEGKTKDALKIQNDSMSDDSFRTFLKDCYVAADLSMKAGAVFYIWHADSEGYNFRGAAHDMGWQIRQCLIWVKQTLVMGRQDYHWKHEPCLYGWKDGAAHLWATDRKQTTVLEFDRPSRSGEHPTMKPIALFEYQMLNNTKAGSVVLDSFGGSGTTIIAAEKNGRIARLMELDPKYCDVIVKRWEDFTGEKAELIE